MYSDDGSGCVVSGVSWEEHPCRPISALPVTSLQLPSRSYKAICGQLLPMLDLEGCDSASLEACDSGLTVNQVRPPPVLGLEQLSKRPRAP